METFGIENAASLSRLAVANGIVRKADYSPFAKWLDSTYNGEEVDYVYNLSLATLHGRFLSERAS